MSVPWLESGSTENTSIWSREFPPAAPSGTPLTSYWYFPVLPSSRQGTDSVHCGAAQYILHSVHLSEVHYTVVKFCTFKCKSVHSSALLCSTLQYSWVVSEWLMQLVPWTVWTQLFPHCSLQTAVQSHYYTLHFTVHSGHSGHCTVYSVQSSQYTLYWTVHYVLGQLWNCPVLGWNCAVLNT